MTSRTMDGLWQKTNVGSATFMRAKADTSPALIGKVRTAVRALIEWFTEY